MKKENAMKLKNICDTLEQESSKGKDADRKDKLLTLLEDISNLMLDEGYCCECGEKIEEKDNYEYMGECHGFPAYMNNTTVKCENCGFVWE